MVNIVKRSGKTAEFNSQKVHLAITKALVEQNKATEISHIVEEISTLVTEGMTVESVQDLIEIALMKEKLFDTAKSFILYRDKKTSLRQRASGRDKDAFDQSAKYFGTPSQMYQFYSKYARWNPEQGRRETWEEAIGRVITFLKKSVPDVITPEEWDELHSSMRVMDALPAMRVLQMAGPTLDRCNMGVYNCAAVAIDSLHIFSEILYISMQGTGVAYSVEDEFVHKLPGIRRQKKSTPKHFVVPDTTEGWADAILLGIKTWASGEDVTFDLSLIRAQGTVLKTKGGRSSGPLPLKGLLEFTKAKILSRQGSRLSSLDCHDICCKIGEIVHVGGVRRSALLALFDLDDEEMRLCKQGQFWNQNPQRFMSNNSAAYEQKPSSVEFLSMWSDLAKSGTGEPGIFNRQAFVNQLPKRRKKVKLLTNPCVTAETLVMTSNGPRRIDSLVGEQFQALVNGEEFSSTANGAFVTGIKPVFKLSTDSGFEVRATENHKILIATKSGRSTFNHVWCELKDVKVGDNVVLHKHTNVEWDGKGTHDEGWLLGSLVGDGNITKSGTANLDYWGDTRQTMMSHAAALVHKTVKCRSDLGGCDAPKYNRCRIESTGVGNLAAQYEIHASKLLSDVIEDTSSSFQRGFLQGWFDSDGSVQGNTTKGVSIRLTSVNLAGLKTAQRMLARLGIISKIYQERNPAGAKSLPDGKGGHKLYECHATHDLVISKDNIQRYEKSIGFVEPKKAADLNDLVSSYKRAPYKEQYVSAVTSIIPDGKETVYDCTVPGPDAFDANGIYVHNCAEIGLRPDGGLCNLSIIVAREDDTPETLKKKARVAAIFGTIQSCLTNFGYVSPIWKKNADEERLLGVDITGQLDCRILRPGASGREELLQSLLALVRETNVEFARRLGINESVATTCVKPSGNSAQLLNCSSGIHPRYAPFYIRRFRAGRFDPLTQMMMDAGVPWFPETGQSRTECTVAVFEFPTKSPEGSITKDDISAVDMLENWLVWKKNYTEHTVSVTVSVGDNEWLQAGNWVYENWESVTGISFLPRDGGLYALAPYETCTEAEYDKRLKEFPVLDFSKLAYYESTDMTTGSQELACVAGNCET